PAHGRPLPPPPWPYPTLFRSERACYALIAKLRDPRAPLQGYPRSEFLTLARAQGQLGTIDRMALFNAFEAVAEQRQRGHRSGLLARKSTRLNSSHVQISYAVF